MSRKVELNGRVMEGCLVLLVPEFVWRMIGATIITMTDVVDVAELKATPTYINNLEILDDLLKRQRDDIEKLDRMTNGE